MQSFRKATTKIWGWSISGCVVLAVITVTFSRADEPTPPRPDDVAPFMRAKLTHAQDVLEGLSLGDFAAIRRGAQELALASQAASWQVLQTVEYARQSAEFRRSCESLKNAAREENLDGATLAWMEVTMKCVQCHKYVRGEASPTPR